MLPTADGLQIFTTIMIPGPSRRPSIRFLFLVALFFQTIVRLGKPFFSPFSCWVPTKAAHRVTFPSSLFLRHPRSNDIFLSWPRTWLFHSRFLLLWAGACLWFARGFPWSVRSTLPICAGRWFYALRLVCLLWNGRCRGLPVTFPLLPLRLFPSSVTYVACRSRTNFHPLAQVLYAVSPFFSNGYR